MRFVPSFSAHGAIVSGRGTSSSNVRCPVSFLSPSSGRVPAPTLSLISLLVQRYPFSASATWVRQIVLCPHSTAT